MSEFSSSDRHFMHMALNYAAAANWRARPNPTVGCIIVAASKVVGRGASERAGGRHAEIVALEEAGTAARGATAYVTLEPCSHDGLTPPCTDSLMAAGLRRVVFAIADPNPAVNGRGAAALRAGGLDVDTGLLAQQATRLHRGFLSRMVRGRPWLCAKIASSLDGATAMASGESQWITGAPARKAGHQLRAEVSALITGVGTVLADNPTMTVRLVDEAIREQPLRVVVDSSLRSPASANIFAGPPTRVYTASLIESRSHDSAAIERRDCGTEAGQVDLHGVLADLGREGHNRVLLEAGATLTGAFAAAGLIDEYRLFMAPRFLGSETRGVLQTPGWTRLADGATLKITAVEPVGDDWMISAFTDSE